jgi:CBS domain-containing protein
MTTVAAILKNKRPDIKTISPDATALALAARLRAERIGAMIVSADGHSIDGIISERDVAYALATHSERLPYLPVSELMTRGRRRTALRRS